MSAQNTKHPEMKEETAELQSNDKRRNTNFARGEGMLVRILFFLLIAAEAMWGTYFTGKSTADRGWLETCAVYLGLFLLGVECALFFYEEFHRRDGDCEELEDDDEPNENHDEIREENSHSDSSSEADVTDDCYDGSTSTSRTRRGRSHTSLTNSGSSSGDDDEGSDTADAAPVE